MIGQVLRISTVFANMMASAGLALAITIGAAGTIEKSRASCYGCLHAASALKPGAVQGQQAIQQARVQQPAKATAMQIAFGQGRPPERALQ
jgi:hypothetical protein